MILRMIVTNRQIHIENKQISDGEVMTNAGEVGYQRLTCLSLHHNHLHHHPRHSRPL